jgi:hypothetical protein
MVSYRPYCGAAEALARTFSRYGDGVLEMRDVCEKCESSLTVDADARICSFECTFCPACATAMNEVCPNCGGELVARPRRATG